MNDRVTIAAMTNSELRTAIRETEKTCGTTVNEANKNATFHLEALREIERARTMAMTDALLAKAGTSIDASNAELLATLLEDRDAEIARLKSELERVTGHGKVVPLGLVLEIMDMAEDGCWEDDFEALCAVRNAIRAAI